MYSDKQFAALEAMCRERAALARKEMEYSLAPVTWRDRTTPEANDARRTTIAGASQALRNVNSLAASVALNENFSGTVKQTMRLSPI